VLAGAVMQAMQSNLAQRTPDMETFLKQIKQIKADDF
jgi:hypothetical protein